MQGMQNRIEKKKSRWSFFGNGKQICMRQMQEHKKKQKRTSSRDGDDGKMAGVRTRVHVIDTEWNLNA